jgi:hypothetical protein
MQYDKAKYKVITWHNGMVLAWLLVPIFAVYELVMGARLPRMWLMDRDSNKPLCQREVIPCPHCHAMHGNKHFHGKTQMYNWFGFYCSSCGKVIPCLWNLTSVIILTVTFPLWIWFYRPLKNKWLKAQPARFDETVTSKELTPEEMKRFLKKSSIFAGVGYGAAMFFTQTPFTNAKNILIGLCIWAIAGWCFGMAFGAFFPRMMKTILSRRKKP